MSGVENAEDRLRRWCLRDRQAQLAPALRGRGGGRCPGDGRRGHRPQKPAACGTGEDRGASVLPTRHQAGCRDRLKSQRCVTSSSLLDNPSRTDRRPRSPIAAVVCASAGNLGQALAWSGLRRGLDVTVVASVRAPVAKLDQIRALDAELELVDGDFELARERAVRIAQERGIRLG